METSFEEEQILKLKNIKKEEIVKVDTERIGTLIFTEDSIRDYSNVLDLLLRLIFVKNDITVEFFNRKFKEYAKHKIRMNSNKINSQKNNFLKAIKRGNVSYFMFQTIISHVLGYNILDLKIDLKIGDVVETYKLQDIFKFPNG